MAGATSSRRALLRAASARSTFQPPTSLRAPSRIPHFHRRCNWSLQTFAFSSALRRASVPLQPNAGGRAMASPSSPSFVPSRRAFSSSPIARHGHLDPPKPGEERTVTFIDKEGEAHKFKVADGDNLLDIAQANDLEMEGACGGSCACSTCHIIVESDHYDAMEEPDDDENDMLDLAFGLTETSRLGCQVKMSKDLDGLVVRLPSMTRNLQASDFVEK